MNREYGTLNSDGELVYAPDTAHTPVGIVVNPSARAYAEAIDGPYYPIEDTPPSIPAPEGFSYSVSHRYRTEERDGVQVPVAVETVYTLVADSLPTLADFDEAMEEHLRREREDRGYTTREPDSYLTSAVPRWSQDAMDWVSHRDAVMGYALNLINAVQAGEREPPTMAEFVAGLPQIEWTYSEES